MYAKIKDTEVVKFPYTINDFYEDNPFNYPDHSVDFVAVFPYTEQAIIHGCTLVDVTDEPQPQFNTETHIASLIATPVLKDGVWVREWELTELDDERRADRLVAVRKDLSDKIDSAVAAVYARPQSFLKEYEEREAQARAYVAAYDADTELPAAPRIVAFAAASLLSNIDAARLTIQQADMLRGALGLLADLRMRKYEIGRATSTTVATAIYTDISAKINLISSSIT